MSRSIRQFLGEALGVLATVVIFWIPFYFVIVNAMKNETEAAALNLSWPSEVRLVENFKEAITSGNHMLLRAFYNSILITLLSLVVMVLVASMVGYVVQRRTGKVTSTFMFFILAGLMIPPAVVPTIWVLDALHLFKTLPGIVLVEVALNLPFATLLYRGFVGTIPRELDEAAMIDGCGPLRLFFSVIFPLLKPVTATIIVTSAVGIYNDFVNPLYFYPGNKNVTLQLALYNFTNMYNTQWNLLFMAILLVTIPPLILFIFFQRQSVAGMAAGSIKG